MRYEEERLRGVGTLTDWGETDDWTMASLSIKPLLAALERRQATALAERDRLNQAMCAAQQEIDAIAHAITSLRGTAKIAEIISTATADQDKVEIDGPGGTSTGPDDGPF